MSLERTKEYLVSLLHELRKVPQETEWVEFKHNQADPEAIGEYISALSNSAALLGKSSGYVIWGIQDETHNIVGTTFQPSRVKVGGEELENWLLHLLKPKIHFRFFEIEVDGREAVVLEIEHAFRHPVQFKNQEFIRVGSLKKRLKEHPEKERALWRVFDQTPFECGPAREDVTGDEVLRLLDYPTYFELMGQPLPKTPANILEALSADRMIRLCETGKWNIRNLGAILFAKNLGSFHRLQRKAVRVVVYRGRSRIETIREQEGTKGYASGFKGLIEFINNLLPSNEVIEKALRRNVPMYPELAVREIVANAVIHQDFSVTGAGPMVEIFDDRMEVTNPGLPLVDTARFLDSPPRSRNDTLASLMRRAGICEERGTGVDKVVFQTELYQLPAPVFETAGENTRVVLFAHRPMSKMDKEDRIRACYLHASLKYVTREDMTNSTLRERFGIEKQNAAIASKIIKDTVAEGFIRPYDATVGTRAMRYVPFWA